jgi:hypothetical protein
MNAKKRIARLVGAMFLVSNLTFIVGAAVFLEPLLSAPDYLTRIADTRAQIVLGSLLELINGVAYVVLGLALFPMLRRRFESLAVGYVGFRLVEFVMQVLADLGPLSLLTLSEAYVGAGAPVGAGYEAAGALLLAQRSWAFQMVSVTFGLSALMFYFMLFRTKHVPRFISIWGGVGAAIVLVNALLDMMGFPPGNLGVIMLLNEVFLGIWLIVKGFSTPVAASSASE